LVFGVGLGLKRIDRLTLVCPGFCTSEIVNSALDMPFAIFMGQVARALGKRDLTYAMHN